jgi:hypothetical protein
MKRLVFTLFALAFVFAPLPSQAQVALGPKVAFGTDDIGPGVGVAVELPLPSLHESVGLLGDFTYFFPDAEALDYFQLNANLTYDFSTDGSITPFALGGLVIARTSVDIDTQFGDFGGSSTDIGLNLGGGIAFDAGDFRPKVGGMFQLEDSSLLQIFAILPFSVGGS